MSEAIEWPIEVCFPYARSCTARLSYVFVSFRTSAESEPLVRGVASYATEDGGDTADGATSGPCVHRPLRHTITSHLII